MMSNHNKATIQAVKIALSPARMGTYEVATGAVGDEDSSALALYAWNAMVSGAFMAPLHICEVVVRNAVSDALEDQYGNRWPWSSGFERSLPDPTIGYSPRKDLQSARRQASTTGKVIPELKFVFWQKMFTGRYDARLWNAHLMRVLPNLDPAKSIGQLRQAIYDDLENIRKLRNRIAHHEPIFKRNLIDDFQKIYSLIEFRCKVTADWMTTNQQASVIVNERP
ncbi:MAG: hypothetical protein PHP05_01065 [Sideroxydans sp.]|nr:hypothetical protein [Sideroxydans sp.]